MSIVLILFTSFFVLLLLALLFEIILVLIVKNFKHDFKWLIEKKDEKPKFNKIKLKKFFNKSFHPIYGWDRKPFTSGVECSNKISK